MNTKVKKLMALFTVAMVLAIAGTALAYGGRKHHGRGDGNWFPMGPGQAFPPGQCQQYQGHPGFRGVPAPHMNRNFDIPQDIRDKQVEADKLRIDLRAELSKPQIDKAKALEIWKKHRALRNEISEWFFTQRLETMSNRPTAPQPGTPTPQTQPQ